MATPFIEAEVIYDASATVVTGSINLGTDPGRSVEVVVTCPDGVTISEARITGGTILTQRSTGLFGTGIYARRYVFADVVTETGAQTVTLTTSGSGRKYGYLVSRSNVGSIRGSASDSNNTAPTDQPSVSVATAAGDTVSLIGHDFERGGIYTPAGGATERVDDGSGFVQDQIASGTSTTASGAKGAAGAWVAGVTALVPISTPTAPSITVQPSSQTVTAGATATFSVTATGTGTLTYQWRRNGSDIGGATSASYTTPVTTVSGGSANNGDLYSVVVTGDTSPPATSSNATLTVNAAGTAPSITVQPASQTVTAGAAATFSVTATGSGALTYQWRRNGTGIGGATSASYTTPATAVSGGSANNGDVYSVVVTGDTSPPATSSNATLTVNTAGVAPSITSQPASQTVTAGAAATFSVAATGSGTLAYQWRRNGTNISGAVSSSYSTPATTVSGGSANNGDVYSVVVTGSTAPPATSNNATLTVNAPSVTSYTAQTDVVAVSGIPLASTLVYYTWCPLGRPGGITAPVNSTTTTDANGRATISHTVAGDGFVIIGTRPGPVVANDRVFGQFLTLA